MNKIKRIFFLFRCNFNSIHINWGLADLDYKASRKEGRQKNARPEPFGRRGVGKENNWFVLNFQDLAPLYPQAAGVTLEDLVQDREVSGDKLVEDHGIEGVVVPVVEEFFFRRGPVDPSVLLHESHDRRLPGVRRAEEIELGLLVFTRAEKIGVQPFDDDSGWRVVAKVGDTLPWSERGWSLQHLSSSPEGLDFLLVHEEEAGHGVDELLRRLPGENERSHFVRLGFIRTGPRQDFRRWLTEEERVLVVFSQVRHRAAKASHTG